MTPGVWWQLRLAASFGEELFGAEMMLDGHLRQQESALIPARNKQAMTANFDLFDSDGKRRKEQGYFDAQVAKFLGTHGWEARIVPGGACGATHNAIAKEFAGVHDADAATQALADVKSNEYSTLLRENSTGGNLRQYLAA
jgi:hypothetical protein